MGGGSSTTRTNQNEQATTVPQTPTYASDPVKNYFAGISNYQQQDPYASVTPMNSLQSGAFNNASGLFQSGQMYGQAAQGAQNVMNATPTTYTAGMNGANTNFAGFNSAGMGTLGNAAQASAQGYQAPSMGSAAQVQGPNLGQASTYNPYMTGQAAQATGTGYQAPNLGQAAQATSQGYGATGYQAPTLGNAAQANLQGYDAGLLGPAAQAAGSGLGGTASQATAASLLDNLDAYKNPATQSLVDTTLGSMDDNASRVRAAQQAQFARSGAFGGSRAAITQAQTEADLGRERGLAEANLRSQAWNAATQLSGQDATNRQATSLFNAGAQNQRDETGAGLTAQNNQFNANAQNQYGLSQFGANNDAAQFGANAANTGALANQAAQNQFGLAQGQLSADAGQFNSNAANTANQFGANAANTAGLANANSQNQFGLAQGQMQADAAQFGAGAQNQASLANAASQNQFGLANQAAQNSAGQFNAGAQNDFALQGANLQQQANLANQSATNQFASQQAGLLADAGQFGANAQNQASLANMAAQNQYGLSQFDAQNQNSMFNASQANQTGQFNAGQANDTSQFNAGQANQNQQFNASTLNDAQQQQLARQLQASGLLGDIAGQQAGDYRADLGMQSDLGNSLWSLQNNYQNAPLNQLQQVGQLLNPGYIQAVSGQTVTGTNSGVSQEKKSGGLFNSLLGVASVAAPFVSDRRAKTDIKRIGKTDGGLPVYTFRYKEGGPMQMGVMAQDVEKMQPEALGPMVGKYKSVYYAEVR